MNQGGPYPDNLVCCDGGPYTAGAEGDAPLQPPGGDSACLRDHKIRIIVSRIKPTSLAEVDNSYPSARRATSNCSFRAPP